MVARRVVGDLHDAPIGRDIAAEDDQSALRLDRIIERPDDLLPGAFLHHFDLLSKGAASHCERRSIDELSVDEPFRQDRDAAGLV